MFDSFPSELEPFAAKLAANWRKFDSFGWIHASDDDAASWGIVYTSNRDSSLLDQSNAAAIADILDRPEYADDVRSESHGHWAVGHVDGYAIRVYGPDGVIRPVVQELLDISNSLADYPVLDDSDLSKREHDAALENIGYIGRSMIRDGAPDGWQRAVFSWLWENDEGELDNHDGNGACPSDSGMRDALEALGLLPPEEEAATE